MSWAGILFDLDGTLADTIPLILASYHHTMKVHRGREFADELWLRHVGRLLTDSLGEFTDDPTEAEAMLETYVTFQRTVHDEMVGPLAGARELLEAVRARGEAVGVVTSKRREMATRTLTRCGLDDLIDVLVTPEDVARGKPDPESVRLALARLDLSERLPEVLFVGDSPFDIAAGRGAGVRTAAVLTGPFGRAVLTAERPDWTLTSLDEVLALRP